MDNEPKKTSPKEPKACSDRFKRFKINWRLLWPFKRPAPGPIPRY